MLRLWVNRRRYVVRGKKIKMGYREYGLTKLFGLKKRKGSNFPCSLYARNGTIVSSKHMSPLVQIHLLNSLHLMCKLLQTSHLECSEYHVPLQCSAIQLVCLSTYHIFSEIARLFYPFVEPSTAGWVAMFLIDRILPADELQQHFQSASCERY